MINACAQKIAARFPGAAAEGFVPASGDGWVSVAAGELPAVALYLRDVERFDCLSCLTACDEKDSVAVVYHLFSYAKNEQLALKVKLSRATPEVPTVSHVWPSADWMERESFDLIGVVFTGHANLRRILLPEEWEGHPLRKDYKESAEALGMPTERKSRPW